MSRLTDRIAQEAARILFEDGIDDPEQARRRAMARLHVQDRRQQPELRAIEQALLAHRRLFAKDDDRRLAVLRQAALDAMRHLERFHPRLVGPVLSGAVTVDSAVQLHLHADHPDEVALVLAETGIDAATSTRRMRLDRQRIERLPLHEFRAGGIVHELLVLPMTSLRQAPLDEDLRSIRRASIRQLEDLSVER